MSKPHEEKTHEVMRIVNQEIYNLAQNYEQQTKTQSQKYHRIDISHVRLSDAEGLENVVMFPHVFTRSKIRIQ